MQAQATPSQNTRTTALRLALGAMIVATQLSAVVAPDPSGLRQKELRLSELDIETTYLTPGQLPASAQGQATIDLAALQAPSSGKLDSRGGRWAAITPVEPLIPGSGVGNTLQWADVGLEAPGNDEARKAAVEQAFRGYLARNAASLRINLSEVATSGRITVHEGGRIAQIYQPRVVEGVPVRDNYLSAVVNSGNLVLFGAEKWGDVDVSTRPTVTSELAWEVVRSHVLPYVITGPMDKSELILVPVAKSGKTGRGNFGKGYGYRLAYVIRPSFEGDLASWGALVDAHSGELISFEDTNQYAEVKGGVLPVSNDGIVPDGVEQPGWPMPFQDVSTTSGTLTTDTGGNLTATGSMTATFFGPYVNINDNCGTDSLTQNDNIDWGASSGTDCVTPGFGGAGNTHASRTGFYELNKIIEMARGQLPSNGWLQNRLTSNMNINQNCNAFWNGTVNFYRSGGGCANTGELAGVFDHEWGHGMDANDATPGIASPSGEGIADIYTALRLNNSCIGRNFRLGSNCTGNGDPCLNCDGVRDIDYLKRASGNPHDYSWSNANCGGSVHCVGGVYSEAVWSLWKRKLQQAPYNYDNNTAHEIVNRLTFIGAGATGTWFSGGPPNGGCAGSSGYMNYLAADDDDGNLNNGTPHMTAIYESFNDQEIACQTPTVQDSGCAGTPTVAPVVSTGNGNQLVTLSWGAVPNTTEYEVFRTEGVFACDFGKVRLGSTTGTSWNDSGLQNGRDYSYVVIPKGSADSCFGPASACATEQPVGQPDFSVSCTPSSFTLAQGDNDTATCTVISSFGYTGSVGLSCSGNPAGVSCSFAPTSVSPPANGSANSTLTLTVSGGQATGNYAFDVVGDDGSTTRTAGVDVQVIPAGSNGPQDAVYDSGLGAPKCAVAGGSCDSTTLLDSRDNLSPAEPNQPNTLDVCADGTSGSYHNDESNDRIVVSTLDGGNFTEGDTVEVAATVWAWSTGSSDTLDLYYAADAMNPSWVFIASIVPPGGGLHTLTAQYVLPAGGMQAVRANFRYQGAASPCTSGSYNDHDDLVFTVEPDVQCTSDAQCDNGAFCDGAETCNIGTGQCEAGTPPVCDDGVSCTVDSCNETTDSCDFAPNDSLCDNGDFCDGAETCSATLGCQAGTAPSVDDGVACTDDSCDEVNDVIVNTPNNANCDNGAFCDGAETCDAVNDCQAGTAPCDPDAETCNEGADVCEPIGCTSDAQCDNGSYCDGAETCNLGTGQCQSGSPIVCDDGAFCNGVESCNEGTDSCDAGTPPACDDGQYCNGVESCNETTDSCDAGTPVTCDDGVSCTVDSCNESTDSCDFGPSDALCDNGQFCDGAETCDAVLDCQSGTPPSSDDGVGCTDDSCDEVNDVIVNAPNDSLCDDGAFCNGDETCDAVLDCQAGTDPCGGGTCDEVNDICVNPPGAVFYMSFRSSTAVPGVGTVQDEDVVSYDEGTGNWAFVFDGSDVGLGGFEIDGLAFEANGDLLLSFRQSGTVGGVSADDSDIVRFAPTSLGASTAGSFSLYFDGSDVGLSSNGEDVDGITLDSSGNLYVTTQGGFSGTGASGADEDLFLFTGTLGSSTSGSFSKYFDGSDVGFGGSGSDDVDAASLNAAGNLVFSTVGNFVVNGLSGNDEDLGEFAGTFGNSTSGSSTMRLDLSTLGISTTEDVGSMHVDD